MSASREKKQRQGGTPSDKTLNAQQQTNDARRKTIQYTVIGVVTAVLVAALLIWNSGIFQRSATAVTVNGTKYGAGEVSYYYRSSTDYRNTMIYAQYGMSDYDTSKSPREQAYGEDGQTYHDYFLKAAMDEMSQLTALYDAAVKDGVKDSDVASEVAETIASAKKTASQNGFSSFKQFLTANYGKYVTPSVFKRVVTRSAVASKYTTDHQEALSYSTDDLKAYYDGHKDDLDSFRYSYLYFTPAEVETTDADGNDIEMTDEEKTAAEEQNLADAKAKAEEALAALKEGKDLTEVSTQTEANSVSEDTVTVGKSLSGVYADWLKNTERKAGDVEMIENGASGFYVVSFGERWLDETPTVNTRHILVRADISDDASAPTDEQMAAAKTKAEELLSQWKSGEATEDSFAALANEKSEDTGSNTNGGLYEQVYKGQFVTNYDAWLFEDGRKSGDTDVVENNGTGGYYGYHVVYYAGQNPDWFKWMTEAKSSLTNDDMTSWTEGLTSGYSAQQADGVKYIK